MLLPSTALIQCVVQYLCFTFILNSCYDGSLGKKEMKVFFRFSNFYPHFTSNIVSAPGLKK